MLATLLSLLPIALAAGCSPEYNWREVHFNDQQLTVMLPGKPSSATRRIDLDGEQVEMTMHGAQAGGNSFAVGVVSLSDDSAARRDKALAAMRAQMIRNIGGSETAVADRTVLVVDASGGRMADVNATVVRANGKIRDEPARMVAGFVGRGRRAMQYLVLGPAAGFDDDQAKVFIDSLRLLQ